MPDVLRPGQVLYGFCGGAFGRDSYDDKRVEAVGADWVVVRSDDGRPGFSAGLPERLLEYTVPRCSGCGKALPTPGSKCLRCDS